MYFNALDGANTDNGLPDGNHIDNANMNTPPDGIPPTMQMYLFHFPGTTDAEEPFLPTSSAFDPSILPRVHARSVEPARRGRHGQLDAEQHAGRSMGEAWSDYYAMDYLVTKGLRQDTDEGPARCPRAST